MIADRPPRAQPLPVVRPAAANFLIEFHARLTATARPTAGSTTRPKNIVGDIGSSLSLGQPAVTDRHDAIGD